MSYSTTEALPAAYIESFQQQLERAQLLWKQLECTQSEHLLRIFDSDSESKITHSSKLFDTMLQRLASLLIPFLLVHSQCMGIASAQLSYGYYTNICPQAESTVRSVIAANLVTDPTASAALLRLLFHDCQVGGCDASIMLNSQDGITSEMVSDANFGIRRLSIIEQAKAAVDSQCGPRMVSCADVIAMAGRDAVVLSGGPDFDVPMGRRDATFASNRQADSSLPPPTISVDQFLDVFMSKGMSLEESVALMGGGHTLGVGHCVSIVNRLYPSTESSLGFIYATRLRVSCPVSNPRFILNATTIQNDFTSLKFDNRYFKDTSSGLGLFTIDAELATDSRTAPIVAQYAQDQSDFFNTFTSAYAKFTSYNVLVGDQGQVRDDCRYVNADS